MVDLRTQLGPLALRSPLIAACGTVGSVVEFAATAPLELYGAAVAKSVSPEPWEGRRPPRLAPAGAGMLNSIGIQNPGVGTWVETTGPMIETLQIPVWGSAVAHTVADFAVVAKQLATTDIAAIEVNLSCPNLDGGEMFALDAAAAGQVVASVVAATDLPVGAKLSPNAERIVDVAAAAATAGAGWVVLGNTVWGAGFDVHTRRPKLSAVVGGYSGPPLKPISLRCVWQVAQALPDLPIVGCGGVRSGEDVVEYLLAGASAVAIGTAHFAEPRAARRIVRELTTYARRHRIAALTELIGAAEPW